MIKNTVLIFFMMITFSAIIFGMERKEREYCLEKILAQAIKINDILIINLILKNGYNINKLHIGCSGKASFGTTKLTGRTLLHLAVYYERSDIFNILLNMGANPYIKDIDGKTTIFYILGLIFKKPRKESFFQYN